MLCDADTTVLDSCISDKGTSELPQYLESQNNLNKVLSAGKCVHASDLRTKDSCTKDSCMKRRCLLPTFWIRKASHLTAFCA